MTQIQLSTRSDEVNAVNESVAHWADNNAEFILPEIDSKYRLQNYGQKPFMLYPGEESGTVPNIPNVIITSFGRVWRTDREEFLNDGKPIVRNVLNVTVNKVKYVLHLQQAIQHEG